MARSDQQRVLVAQCAARLLAEGAVTNYAAARSKAAAQLGISNKQHLPDNREIELALSEYQQLFQHHSHPLALAELRQTAREAMKLLAPFSPRLVGNLVNDTADQHTPIELHLFANTSEEIAIFLMEHNIPYAQSEKRVRYAKGHDEYRPQFSFLAGENAIELVQFPAKGLHQPPLCPISGKGMERWSLKKLEQVLNPD